MGAMRADGSVLEGSSLFAGFDRSALDALMRSARMITVAPDETLFVQGDAPDGCYAILEGVLKVSIIGPDGEEALLALVGAGEVIGEMAMIDGQPRSATLAALKQSTLAFISKPRFTAFAESCPAIYRHMLEMLVSRLRRSNEAFAGQLLLPLGGRLARALLRLTEVFGHPLADGRILIRQKLTQSDLALMTASARENVNRQLAEWRAAGIISRISAYYCVEDIDRLRSWAKL
jgi:CRP/FNR family transcriptional regulator, cyclic AMP receptor protein